MYFQGLSKDWSLRVDDLPNVGPGPRPLHHHLRDLYPGVLTGNVFKKYNKTGKKMQRQQKCLSSISLTGIFRALPVPGWRGPVLWQPNEDRVGQHHAIVHHVARHLRQPVGTRCRQHRSPLHRSGEMVFVSKKVLDKTF